jgi:flagellar hook-associated protein 2
MAGTISSLGILGSGSTSSLNSDLIDKLKAAEKSSTVNPINTSITKIKSQQSDLSSLTVTLSSLKSSVMDLGDSSSYLKRSATSTDTAVGITAGDGVQTQDATVNVTQLAQNHVMQSSGFTGASSTVALSNTTLELKLGSTSYSVTVSAGTTLEQLAQKINDATSGAISASTLNTGVGTNPYKLILKSRDTGEDSAITVTEGSGLSTGLVPSLTGNAAADASSTATLASGAIKINGTSIGAITLPGTSAVDNATAIKTAINLLSTTTGVSAEVDATGKLTLKNSGGGAIALELTSGTEDLTGLLASGTLTNTTSATTLQEAKNAEFTYNGISMIRSKNSISDIIVGATISLNKVSTSAATLSIKQNTSGIPDLVNTFISAFNSANSKIKDLTAFDSATKKTGSLQGVSDISSLHSSLSSIITSQTKDGKTLMDYGFALDKSGMISVDSTVLNSKLSADPAALEKLFRGSTTIKNATYTGAMKATNTDTTGVFGDIKINGTSIGVVNTLSTNTDEQNAQLFASKINEQSNTTGVKAYTDGSGKLVLQSLTDARIELETTANGALASGLSSSDSVAAAMSNRIVSIGSTTSDDGIFSKLNTKLAQVVTSTNASLKLFSNSLQSQLDTQNKALEKATERLDQKYEMLASQYSLYNSMISKFQQSFASLSQQINSSSNGN